MQNTNPAIIWFRRDLRLRDHAALTAAAGKHDRLHPCFILDDGRPEWADLGGASKWWLHHSLEALAGSLGAYGLRLTLRRGGTADTLRELCARTGASHIYCSRLPDPEAVIADRALQHTLLADGLNLRFGPPGLLFEPPGPLNRSGEPYRVFSPFWRACLAMGEPATPLPVPALPAAAGDTDPLPGDALSSWQLTPSRPDWAGGLRRAWQPGEAGGVARLEAFIDGPAPRYARDRDLPGRAHTSRLSPHLHWGEISPRTVWHAVRAATASDELPDKAADKFLAELGWREFSHHLLHHFPDIPTQNLNSRFDRFPWADPVGEDAAAEGLAAWQRGRTGYPIVDAGMRELWETGWMHNRVRMIVASFLVKDLRLHWRVGAEWFWDTLVDADLASNSASWQWVAGSGADAAPFFRIFNPVLQGRKFDPDGRYVRQWVPELSGLPDKHLHAPWEAGSDILRSAGIDLGTTYPRPAVDHAEARRMALVAFDSIKDAAE